MGENTTTLEFKLEGFEDLGGGDMPVKQEPQKKTEQALTCRDLLIEHGRVEALKAYIMASWYCIDAETCLNILGMSMLGD